MKKQDEYAHGCLICIGTGKLCVVIDGHSNGPTDCSGCDASGRVDKETFMKQLKIRLPLASTSLKY